MTVAVTGASGFVGVNLIRALRDEGRPVRAVIANEAERPWLDGLDVEIVCADVRDPDAVTAALAGAEAVFHLAGIISLQPDDWPRVEAVNVRGVAHVVEACLTNHVRRLVHFSSFHAIVQEPLGVPLDETSPLISAPDAPPYNRSKALGELAVRAGIEHGLDAVIVNPTGIIGPNDQRPSYFGQVILDLASGQLPALVTGGCDWVDVRDVVAGALAAERNASTGRKYMLSGHWVTLPDIAVIVAQATGTPAPRAVLPMWMARGYAPLHEAISRRQGRVSRLTRVSLEELSGNPQVSHARAARELDYQPRPFRETLLDALAWFAAHGMLATDSIASN
jgi:dihydroflavonol-4-reductase